MTVRPVLEILLFYVRYGAYSSSQDVRVIVHRQTARLANRSENVLQLKNIQIYWYMCTYESLQTVEEYELNLRNRY
jgi:hypothetical protein